MADGFRKVLFRTSELGVFYALHTLCVDLDEAKP
jgi:hypothetical protein